VDSSRALRWASTFSALPNKCPFGAGTNIFPAGIASPVQSALLHQAIALLEGGEHRQASHRVNE